MVNKLPSRVASLLKYGVAVEFMDGENAFVATIWLKAIMDSLDETLDGAQIHV
jgi:hypothetical protein